jgi:hypothetical protein
MIRTLIQRRFLISSVLAAVVWFFGRAYMPWPADNPLVALIYLHNPTVYQALASTYALLWYTTPLFTFNLVFAALFIFIPDASRIVYQSLPPYPAPASRPNPSLIIGEQHYSHAPGRSPTPTWLTIPERGLYTGLAVIGAIGSGKTSAALYPFADQLLGWAAHDEERKFAGLVMEVKGDFCRQVQRILKSHGRGDDYIELGLDGAYCYNPMVGDVDPFATAYSIATLINQLYGRSKEPFWQQAYTHLVHNVITAAKLADGYTTLADVYEYCVSPDALEAMLGRARDRHATRTLSVTRETFLAHQGQLAQLATWKLEAGQPVSTPHSESLSEALTAAGISFDVTQAPGNTPDPDAPERFRAVERWYQQEWLRLEPRLRASIVEGIAVFLGLFADPAIRRTFSPPHSAYLEPGSFPLTPLPPLADIIEQGRVLALNFPAAANPGLAKIVGALLKQDFQRCMLARIARMESSPARFWRAVLMLIDEYHQFATAGGMDPSGDERFLALSRQARLVPIVATQSISSLRSALPDENTWRTLLQCFRTKLFLTLSDDMSAQLAAELCGRCHQLQPEYTVTEAGQDSTVSLLTGKTASPKTTINLTKHYNMRVDYLFQPRIFTELRNAQAIALPYDGHNPMRPTYVYLKPHYLDKQQSYFDHVAQGVI